MATEPYGPYVAWVRAVDNEAANWSAWGMVCYGTHKDCEVWLVENGFPPGLQGRSSVILAAGDDPNIVARGRGR